IDLARAVPCLFQFIGQSHRKAAGVSGCDKFRRIRATPLGIGARPVGSFLQDSTRRANGAFATLASSQPKDSSLPGVWSHAVLRINPFVVVRQYLEGELAIP